MKKFKFSLQSVHNTRESKREQEQLKLSEKQVLLAEASARLTAAEQNRSTATNDFANKIAAGAADAFEMDLTAKYLNALFVRETEARAAHVRAENECSEQSRRVACAAQAVEATAKLRERQRERFLLDAAHAEQTALDEMVAIHYARRISEQK